MQRFQTNMRLKFREQVFAVMFVLNNHSVLAADEKGALYQIYLVPKVLPFKKKSPLAMPCQVLCNHDLGRFHLSCLNCRTRKVWRGKMDPKQKVHVYTITIRDDRALAWLRDRLIKPLASLIEFLAS